jgi:hypothetical protein
LSCATATTLSLFLSDPSSSAFPDGYIVNESFGYGIHDYDCQPLFTMTAQGKRTGNTFL